ncbi:MAG: hypothetical protein AAFV33_10205 [Chloroflexota bacterium]
MPDLSSLKLGRAFGLITKTMPILLVRMGAYLVFWVATLIYLSITGGVSWLVGQAVSIIGVILFIASIAAIGPIYRLAYQYVFYMIKAAHLAVVAEILQNGKLPAGESQLDWGRKAVTQRFGETSAMFLVDEAVESVIRAFTNTVYRFSRIFPGESMEQLARVANRVVRFSLTYVDEAILARSFWRKDENVWESAEDGLVLYAQSWKPLLTNAVVLMLLSYVPFIVAFLVVAAPLGALVAFVFNTQVAGWSIILTLIFAWLVKVAIGDAFAMVAMLASYHETTQDMTPNPEMSAQLSRVSDKFNEIKQRAARAASPPADASTASPADMGMSPQPDV